MLTAHRGAPPGSPRTTGAPSAGSRVERLRRRRRRFRELMAVVVVLGALLGATVAILSLQWLDNGGNSGASSRPSGSPSGLSVSLRDVYAGALT